MDLQRFLEVQSFRLNGSVAALNEEWLKNCWSVRLYWSIYHRMICSRMSAISFSMAKEANLIYR